MEHNKIRGAIKSGDIIFFKGKSLWGRLIRWWTKSPYSHVGMALVGFGRVWLLEASETGQVRLIPLSKKGNFTLVKTGLNFSLIEDEACLKVGQRYDYLGAIKAAFKLSRNNQKYYCSELVAELLIKAGFQYLYHPQTPALLLNYLTEYQEFTTIEVKEAYNAKY